MPNPQRKKTSKAISPVDRVQRFLKTQHDIPDLRTHAILLFSAFEKTVRALMAWRLSCNEEKLPPSLGNNPLVLVETVICLHHDSEQDTRGMIRTYLAARGALANPDDATSLTKLGLFATQVLREGWPASDDEKRDALGRAALHLTTHVVKQVYGTEEKRGAFPFPEIVGKRRKRRT